MFAKIGSISYPATVAADDRMFEAVVEAGAENVETADGIHEVTTKPADFSTVKEKLEKNFGPPQSSGIIWKPTVTVAVTQSQAEELIELIEALEDLDDVQNVFTNFEVAQDVMERLGNA